MAQVKCTNAKAVHAAIEAGDVPEIHGDFTVKITVDCRLVIQSGSPTVEANGSSQPRVVANGSSQPTVEANGSSQPRVVAYDSSQPRVEAYDSSQPTVVAYDSSQPRVVAYGSSQPRVEANGSSQPRVEAYGSSQPRVEAYGSSQPTVVANGSSQPTVVAYDSSQPTVVAKGYVQISVRGRVAVKAVATVAVLVAGTLATIEGAGFIQHVDQSTPRAWCEHYGVEIREFDGVECAILFKGLDENFTAKWREFKYLPGTTPACDDWDPKVECGRGLHFSPSCGHTREFIVASKWVACPVKLEDIVVHPDGTYPQKCKAPRLHAPCWEVDRDGEPVVAKEGT